METITSRYSQIVGTVQYAVHCVTHFGAHFRKNLAGLDSDNFVENQAQRIGKYDFISKVESARKNKIINSTKGFDIEYYGP